MRHWKRVVAVLLVAAIALVVEGWVARAPAAPTLFKNCQYVRTAGETGRPPYSLAPTIGLVRATVRTNRGDLVLTLDRSAAPCAVHSFTYLALKRFYNQTPCSPTLECGTGHPGYHFTPEPTGHETYPQGTVALSNTPGVGNTSTFSIARTNTTLPHPSTIIGTLTAGLPVLNRNPTTILEILIG
ncbi:peptidylprolyl isomerase [Kribbella sp. NPDC058693]|uniref:peptidylprolyl isomerase n=1 Tax=Kribbella sp. NPDC058693 TaxID=3346602 RepID=UPI003652CCFB